MDNKEAISVLESINAKTDYFLINDDARAEAIDMAISALQAHEVKQEVKHSTESSLTQKALDTISRAAAIDALKDLPTWWADEGGYYGGAQPPMKALLDPEDAISAIENLPSAQPEETCGSCLYRGLGWHEEPCDSCTVGGNSNHYKPSIEKENGWAD